MPFLTHTFMKVLRLASIFRKLAERPKSVVAVILKGDQVMGVARREDATEWGLPGGKVEPGEDLKEALVREVKEEANIFLDKDKLEHIYETEDGPYLAHAFLYHGSVPDPEQGDAGPAEWISWDELLEGPFGEYNQAVKSLLGL
jgi:8-oxo-dGTP pyrophosphatase MutT (NUDIX family)